MQTSLDSAALKRLLALVVEALALADTLDLHATGIALDTARLGAEEALAAARRASGPRTPQGDPVPSINPGRNGLISRDRG